MKLGAVASLVVKSGPRVLDSAALHAVPWAMLAERRALELAPGVVVWWDEPASGRP